MLCVVSGLRRYNKQNTGLVVCHCHTVKRFVLNENTYICECMVSLCVYMYIHNHSRSLEIGQTLNPPLTVYLDITHPPFDAHKHKHWHTHTYIIILYLLYSIHIERELAIAHETKVRTGSRRAERRSGRYK